jgi:aryl-alcohol dehydrogenase-like predicted oxidoreductase
MAATLGYLRPMHTRTIPSSGKPLPVIGCGTWLGFDVARDPPAIARRGEVLDALFDAGGSVIDSSPMYGGAEQVVGELLASSERRARAFVATKVWTQGRREGVVQMERSLRLLQGDRVDLMQVHNLLDWQAHLATLRDWKAQRRVTYVGVTHYNEAGYAELEKVMQGQPLDFVQFNYSVSQREAERRLLPLAAERGIAVLVNLPFGGGKAFKALLAKPLPAWAAAIDCASWNQVLLKFVLSQPAVTCVIPGTSRPDHMAANAAAGSGEIPPRAWWDDKIDAILS